MIIYIIQIYNIYNIHILYIYLIYIYIIYNILSIIYKCLDLDEKSVNTFIQYILECRLESVEIQTFDNSKICIIEVPISFKVLLLF